MVESAPLRITVTEDDIRAGIPYDIHSCAVALAARRTVSGLISVANDLTVWDEKTELLIGRYPLPHEVYDFINDFDNGIPVHPLSFELRVLEGAQKWMRSQ